MPRAPEAGRRAAAGRGGPVPAVRRSSVLRADDREGAWQGLVQDPGTAAPMLSKESK
ncbi:hypothetical protein OHS71_17855 [Streptomyces sp. NBC_00377]|uniref:hypothetical protein n=1 Tax=unclassified Streptomyces TaxID=2593676 RepID=UPI002E222446|nr:MULTISPECIES: hypothetical protein [unclassified Streptomyces]